MLYRSGEWASSLDDFKGGMTENYVCGQLISIGYPCYFWMSERGVEVDFVIQREGKVIPIEVKSSENTKAKSLNVYIDTYKPAYAVKLSTRNFGFEPAAKTSGGEPSLTKVRSAEGSGTGSKKSVPLYAVFCL